MKTANIDWLKQDSIDGNWRRVLVRGGGDYAHQIEVLLTPSNNTIEEWAIVNSTYIIRTDVRENQSIDHSVWTHELPDRVFDTMRKELGTSRAEFLLNANIYSLIDWTKFAQNDHNGCKLGNCMKDFTWHFENIQNKGGEISSLRVSEMAFLSEHEIRRGPNRIMIGGVAITNDDARLYVCGYYDVVTGYVCFETRHVVNGEDHLTRFNQRLKSQWQSDLIEHIRDLSVRKQITPQSEEVLVNMINTAATTLMTFCIE